MTTIHKPHPILIIAALSIIIFSLAGVAALMGWLPNSHSAPGVQPEQAAATDNHKSIGTEPSRDATEPKQVKAKSARLAAADTANKTPTDAPRAAKGCPDCGIVESVKVVELEGQGSGLGAVAGGVVGGLLGNQIGKGRGNTVATVAGVAGGAYAGHTVEKTMKKTKRFDIVVRMEDGAERTFHRDTDPGLASGQKVRIEGSDIVPQ